ncbi:hypothetical protein CICLE_v10014464mg [Citrus x clementina]|uniref:Receptor-like serine/threonine-protein kinase n=2 Tax=Citrus clementina TaxID=85681 RepID=V4UG55_CITCL|nr:hypothetical protein CICLE_v10014464mg [Citrus x clementina]
MSVSGNWCSVLFFLIFSTPFSCLVDAQRYACGFFCNGTCDSYLFAVFIVQTNSVSNIVSPAFGFPHVVWSANRNNPVRINATLELTSDGNLVLQDADGAIAWSTNTSGKSVVGLNLTDMGNLVLFDKNKAAVWQSFDHPTDSLVPGQKLLEGKKLTASVSTTNWTDGGLLSLSVTNEGLFAFIESNNTSVPYYKLLTASKTSKEPSHARYLNRSLALFINTSEPREPDGEVFLHPALLFPGQYMRLWPDGHLRVYEWQQYNGWTVVGDLLTGIFGECGYPLKKGADEIEEDCLDQVPGLPKRFSFEELKVMTDNFRKILGKGGFGSVFEGTQTDGTKVAVKRLEGIGEINKSFLAEVKTIGSIHHLNLLRLIGFCAEKSQNLLVYEYMPNGSLDRWLFQRSDEFMLDWQQRKKIILDIAKGLTYLHADCRQKILHLDIKPQNILLDDNFNAKVADFGLSKLIDRDQSQVVTTMRGTPGYLAPEWLSSVITEKVDIYSFGVVMLEILCGRKVFDRSQPEEEDMYLLSIFNKKAEEDKLSDLVDRHSNDMQSNEEEVVNMMKVAAWCLESDFVKRPSMSMVVKVLEDVTEFEHNLHYNLVLTEFVLVSVTSAVTVQIAGVVKEAVTILVAVFYFHDEFSWLKGFGLFTILVGVSLFNWYKYQKLQAGHANEDGMLGSRETNASAKYVILEEIDDLDEGT